MLRQVGEGVAWARASMRLIMSLFSMTQQIHFMRHGQALHNVRAAGYRVVEVNNLFLDVVKTIRAVNPET